MTLSEQREAARQFANKWNGKGREDEDARSYWFEILQKISGKPVVGIAECSMKYAAAMGNGYAVVSPSLNFVSRKIALARKYHVDDLLRTVIAAKSSSKEDLLEACKTAKNTFGVDVIVLGCANYAGCDAYLEREVGIPVLDGVACALITAAGLARYRKYKESH